MPYRVIRSTVGLHVHIVASGRCQSAENCKRIRSSDDGTCTLSESRRTVLDIVVDCVIGCSPCDHGTCADDLACRQCTWLWTIRHFLHNEVVDETVRTPSRGKYKFKDHILTCVGRIENDDLVDEVCITAQWWSSVLRVWRVEIRTLQILKRIPVGSTCFCNTQSQSVIRVGCAVGVCPTELDPRIVCDVDGWGNGVSDVSCTERPEGCFHVIVAVLDRCKCAVVQIPASRRPGCSVKSFYVRHSSRRTQGGHCDGPSPGTRGATAIGLYIDVVAGIGIETNSSRTLSVNTC